jgi:hypothetical protein
MTSEPCQANKLSENLREVESLLSGETITGEFRARLEAAAGGIRGILASLGRLDAGVQTSVELNAELLGDLHQAKVYIEKLIDRDDSAAALAVGAKEPEVGILRGEFLNLETGAAALGASGFGHGEDGATPADGGQS